jgi:hypothetical protein
MSFMATVLDRMGTCDTGAPPYWVAYREAIFGRDLGFDPAEAALVEAGIRWPIAARLRYWAGANQRTLDRVPADRLLVVRTEELDVSRVPLAEFVGIDPATLTIAHANSNERQTGVVDRVPRQYVDEVISEYCAPLTKRYSREGL